MIMPGVINRRNSAEDTLRKLLKNSKAERVRNAQWKLDDRKLDKELRMIERDRKRSGRLLHREKFGVAMELREMKKEAAEVRNVRNESCSVVGDGSLVRLNKQKIRERRLSLPINLVSRPVSAVSSDGQSTSGQSLPGSRRPFRPGSSSVQQGCTPLSTDDISRYRRPSDPYNVQNGDGSELSEPEFGQRLCYENGRWQRPSTAEMTPDDVKLNFMRRNSMKDIADYQRMHTPGTPQEYDFHIVPRSRLALRRQSMPDIGRARTAILLGTTPNLEPVGEIDDPVNDPRFRSLMGTLSKEFDGLDTKNKKVRTNKTVNGVNNETAKTPSNAFKKAYTVGGVGVTTEPGEPPYRTTGRRMSSAF